jgi:aryl-alcohol dehydrogenase-like predicted oxidoreductase
LLDKGLDIFPIPGTKRVKYLKDNIGAVDVKLSQHDRDRIAELLRTFPISGRRYDERNAQSLDHDQ